MAGSVGPLNVTLSMSARVDDPSFRAATFDEVRDAYAEQIRGLVEGGVDLLLIETVFDTLNAKAAIVAAQDVAPGVAARRLADGGRSQRPDAVGPDGGGVLGLDRARAACWRWRSTARWARRRCAPWLVELARVADVPVWCYPNAGLPNAFGGYDEQAPETAALLREFAESGLVNAVGGCCGTTPEHVAAIAAAVAGLPRARFRHTSTLAAVGGPGAVRGRGRRRAS